MHIKEAGRWELTCSRRATLLRRMRLRWRSACRWLMSAVPPGRAVYASSASDRLGTAGSSRACRQQAFVSSRQSQSSQSRDCTKMQLIGQRHVVPSFLFIPMALSEFPPEDQPGLAPAGWAPTSLYMHKSASHLSALNGLWSRRSLWRSTTPLRKQRPQRPVCLIRLGPICSIHPCNTQHIAEGLCNSAGPGLKKTRSKEHNDEGTKSQAVSAFRQS